MCSIMIILFCFHRAIAIDDSEIITTIAVVYIHIEEAMINNAPKLK